LEEIRRVICKKGLCVFTTPSPLYDHLVTLVASHGELAYHHVRRYTLKQLSRTVENAGFSIIGAQKFLLVPFEIPHWEQWERIVHRLRLSFLMFNQVVVAEAR
jgi:hypothetical protein